MVFSNIIKDKYLRVVGALSLLVLLVAGIIFYLQLGAEPTTLIIHFNAEKGSNLLGGRGDLFTAFFIILVNSFLADFIYKRERLLSYLFSFSGLALAILILMAVSAIIAVN
jgi:hypothetical protein